MTIFYLLLKNHNYIKLSSVDNIFPRMKSDIFKKMISMLQGIVADEITKNEINSYILLEDY